MAEEIELTNPELTLLLNNKAEGFKYRERRESQWRENYTLYRDTVQINRLTQRQSVNLPLMKTVLKTILKDNDEMHTIKFQNLDNDSEAETFQNEHWKYTLDRNNAEIQDVVDTKQNFLFGRTFDSWQIVDGEVRWNVEDPEDILVSRFMNPYDVDSSRYLIHTHIFVPLSSLVGNKEYDQDEVGRLVTFFESNEGIVKARDNDNILQKKNQKLSDMGVTDVDDPVLGETYVELTMHRVYRPAGEEWIDDDGKKQKTDADQIFSYIEAEDMCILQKKPQEVIIGETKDHFWRNHYNYDTWSDDVEKQDFWNDGHADTVRTPNKIINAWFSQEIERRTLSNFGMTFYNSALKAEGFVPGTFEPRPFGFYGVPGNPNDVLKRVEIPMNDGNLEAINFITEFTEKATGATPGQQGVNPPSGTPLGTTQIVEGEAKARTQMISKFKKIVWEQRGLKYLKLLEAGKDKINEVKIYMKGRNSDRVFPRDIGPSDWMTESGYKVKVWSRDDKDSQDAKMLERQNAVKMNMPDNPKVDEIYKRKLVEWAGYTPDEINEVMDYEKKKMLTPMVPGANNGLVPQQQQPMQNGTMGNPMMQK